MYWVVGKFISNQKYMYHTNIHSYRFLHVSDEKRVLHTLFAHAWFLQDFWQFGSFPIHCCIQGSYTQAWANESLCMCTVVWPSFMHDFFASYLTLRSQNNKTYSGWSWISTTVRFHFCDLWLSSLPLWSVMVNSWGSLQKWGVTVHASTWAVSQTLSCPCYSLAVAY